MHTVITLAAEGEELPLEGGPSILLPTNYDLFWSAVVFVILALIVGGLIGWLFGSRGAATATERGC